jgi:Zn-dependent M28 family amino/carboxypeptidase
VLLEGRKLSQSVIDGLAAAAATYTGLTVKTSLNAADSDHESFLDKGIPAVLTIEGADHSNHEIHSARDTLDRINFDLALEILRMNTAFVADALGRK